MTTYSVHKTIAGMISSAINEAFLVVTVRMDVPHFSTRCTDERCIVHTIFSITVFCALIAHSNIFLESYELSSIFYRKMRSLISVNHRFYGYVS
uniref:7TM_GPCR_Srx domain-containing protein n=1 Tax=Ascaris lumbricoides TaxID=6252 RepID=A0A0M3IHR5_ASCLU